MNRSEIRSPRRRGLVHAHSYYSHDACDDMPVVDGVRDEVCYDDFRRGMCRTQHDFIMLSDHPAEFADCTPTSSCRRRSAQPYSCWCA